MNQPRLPLTTHIPPPRKKTPLWLIALGIAVPIGLLAACSALSNGESDNGTPPTDMASLSETETRAAEPPISETIPPPPENATVEDLRIYYEALVAELNQTLLDERTDRFLSDHASQERIEELETALADAQKKLAAVGGTTDKETHTATETVGSFNSGASTAPDGESTEPSTRPSDDRPSGDTPTPPLAPYAYRIENQQVIITAYIGKGGDVTIPASMEGYPVTAIAEGAFQSTPVTSVTVPNTVTHIGWFAFNGCRSLKTVVLPSSVTLIEYGAFDGCPSVTLVCAADSYAARYAASFGLAHRAA